MKKSSDTFDRVRKKCNETLESVEEAIQKITAHNNGAMSNGGKGASSFGRGTAIQLPPDADIKREINKLMGVRDRIKSKAHEAKDTESEYFLVTSKRLERLLEKLKYFEKAAGKGKSGSTGDNQHSKSSTAHFLKDAMGNIKQRILSVENELGRKGGSTAGGSVRGKGGSGGRNSLSPAEALERYQNQYCKLELVLQLVQNEVLRPEEVDTVRNDVRELLKDKVDGETLGKVEWFEQLVGSLARRGVDVNSKAGPLSGKLGVGRNDRTGGQQQVGSHGGTSPQLPRPSLSRAGGPRGLGGDGLDDDGVPPAWADDDTADANNGDTFGEDSTTTTGGATRVGSLAEMMQATQRLAALGEEERRRRQANKQQREEEERERRRRTPQQDHTTNPSAAATASSASRPADPNSTSPSNTNQKEGKSGRDADHGLDEETVARMLEMSLFHLSHPLDADRQRAFQPPNVIEPMDSFPSEIHPILSHRHIYDHFDDSTLFFIFYYHQKNYQHLYASRELRKRHYRFRRSDTTWYRLAQLPLHKNGHPSSDLAPSPPGGAQPQQPLPEGGMMKMQHYDYQQEWLWKDDDRFATMADIDDLEP